MSICNATSGWMSLMQLYLHWVILYVFSTIFMINGISKKNVPSSVWNKNLTNFFFIFRIVENICSVYTIEAFCSALFLWTLRKIYSSLYVNLAPPLRHWSLKVSFAVFLYLLLAYQKKYSQSSVEPFCVSWCNIWIRW